jgi:hypothetical protein
MEELVTPLLLTANVSDNDSAADVDTDDATSALDDFDGTDDAVGAATSLRP